MSLIIFIPIFYVLKHNNRIPLFLRSKTNLFNFAISCCTIHPAESSKFNIHIFPASGTRSFVIQMHQPPMANGAKANLYTIFNQSTCCITTVDANTANQMRVELFGAEGNSEYLFFLSFRNQS